MFKDKWNIYNTLTMGGFLQGKYSAKKISLVFISLFKITGKTSTYYTKAQVVK